MSKNDDVLTTRPWNLRFKPPSDNPSPPKTLSETQRKQSDTRRRIEIILEQQALDNEWR